jgi:hypothetical protein
MIEEAAKRMTGTGRRAHVTVAHAVDQRIGKRRGGDARNLLEESDRGNDVAADLVRTRNSEKKRINHPSNQRQWTQRKKNKMKWKNR